MTAFDGYRARVVDSFTETQRPMRLNGSVLPKGTRVANVLTPSGEFAGQVYVANGSVCYFNPMGMALTEQQKQGLRERKFY